MQQSQDELIIEVTLSALNHWAKTPGKKPANLLPTKNNSLFITTAIANHIRETGRKPSVDEVDAIVKGLGDIESGGTLHYRGTQKPTVEEIAKNKKEAFEIAHSRGFKGGSQNNKTELQRDDDKKQPVRTEAEKQAINSRNAQMDEIIRDTTFVISNYSAGKNHARTQERRTELTALLNHHMAKVKDVATAETLQRTIASKIDSYDKNNNPGVR